MVDASACLLTKIQGRGRRRPRGKPGQATLPSCLPGDPQEKRPAGAGPGRDRGRCVPPGRDPAVFRGLGAPALRGGDRASAGRGPSRTRRRGGPERPGCGSLAQLAGLFPRSIGAAHGRGAGARSRGQPRARGPRGGDAGLGGPGGCWPPGRRRPQAGRVRCGGGERGGVPELICNEAGGSHS